MTPATLAFPDPRASRELRGLAREVKFVVEPHIGARMREWARVHLDADPHGSGPCADEYDTTSLYFDTAELDVFHSRGSYRRAKYRIRRYGASDLVFLERKLRTKVLLAKRRTTIALGDLPLVDEADYAWSGTWFQKRLDARRLRPACQVSYRRTARVGVSATGPIRLTFDERLRAQSVSTVDFVAQEGRPVFEGHVIVEMKFRAVVPGVFKRLIEEFGLVPEPVSKYRLAMCALTGSRSPVPERRKATLQLAFA
jgi:hypothetical protein